MNKDELQSLVAQMLREMGHPVAQAPAKESAAPERAGTAAQDGCLPDITQIDLPSDKTSGLKDAVRILENIPDIAICRLTASDVVRHALVQKIIAAYESGEKKQLPAQKKLYRKK